MALTDTTIQMSAGDNRHIRFDFGDFGEFEDGETIVGTPTVTGTGLTITGVTVGGYLVLFWLSGGTAGQTFTLTVGITMSSGATIVRSTTVQVY
jgi:hypothetical protein